MQVLGNSMLTSSPQLLPAIFLRLQVADMLAEGAGKVRLADADFDLCPVKTWLGRQATERVEGWETEVGRGRVWGFGGFGVRRGNED